MRWDILRSIGNSRAVQMSVLFPAIGYLILFNDQVARFLSMQALEVSSTGSVIEFLWRTKLYFLYFGLMAMGVGSGIYQMACPFIIKKHGDSLDYIRIDGNSISYQSAQHLGHDLGMELQLKQSKDALDNDIMNIMQNWYADQSKVKPYLRNAVTALFGIGGVLLAIPSVAAAIKIAASLLQKLG